MAVTPVNLAAITDALAQTFAPRITAQMNRSVVLLQLLPYAEGRGKNMAWDVEFSNANATADSTLAEGADVSVYNDDDVVPAVLSWADYSEAIQITGKARAVAASTGNPDDLIDLFGHKIESAVRRLCKNLGRDIYTGSGSSDYLLGLFGGASLTSGAPLSTAGTYATIARGTYSEWAGNVLANGGVSRPLDIALMRRARRTIYEACGEMPDLIVCNAAQHEAYGALFGTERRYVQEITLRGQKIVLDGGYRALEFDGIPVVADVNCPAGSMIFMNTNYIKMRQLVDSVDSVNGSRAMVGLHGSAEEQFGASTTQLTARLSDLALTGDMLKFQMVLYPQLQVERCNAHCLISDLA